MNIYSPEKERYIYITLLYLPYSWVHIVNSKHKSEQTINSVSNFNGYAPVWTQIVWLFIFVYAEATYGMINTP